MPAIRRTAVSVSGAPLGAAASAGVLPGGYRLRWPARLSPAVAAMIAATVLGLGLRVFLLTRPGFLVSGTVEYDDGVYLGAAIRLLQGALPYRDYAFVQPPGILLVSVPAALIATVASPAAGLAAARVLTICASTACIPLAGNLIRFRGALATAVTCGLLAVYPADVLTARTLLLEPWMNLCCLLAANAAFSRGRLAGPRRLAWAGAALGFGAAIKLWAAVPAVLLLLVCLLVRDGAHARRTGAYAAALGCGFAVPVAPFAVGAPLAFLRATVADQVTRAGATTPLSLRLAHLTGLVTVLNRDGKVSAARSPSLFTMASNATTAIVNVGWPSFVVALVAAALLAAAYAWRPRQRSAVEWFALGTAVASSAAILGYSAFFYHYPDFPAPWIAIAAGGAAGAAARAGAGTGPGAVSAAAGGRGRDVRRWLAVGATVVIVAVAVLEARELAGVRVPDSPTAAASIPAGACLVTDQVSFAIAADRFTAPRPGCPDVLDSLATTLVVSGGVSVPGGAGQRPNVTAAWEAIFGHAQYVWLSGGYQARIPWTPGLQAWFSGHFRLVEVFRGYGDSRLYVRAG